MAAQTNTRPKQTLESLSRKSRPGTEFTCSWLRVECGCWRKVYYWQSPELATVTRPKWKDKEHCSPSSWRQWLPLNRPSTAEDCLLICSEVQKLTQVWGGKEEQTKFYRCSSLDGQKLELERDLEASSGTWSCTLGVNSSQQPEEQGQRKPRETVENGMKTGTA